MGDNASIRRIEDCASLIVADIEQCVSVIREVPEFAISKGVGGSSTNLSSSLSSSFNSSSVLAAATAEEYQEVPLLFSQLKDSGVLGSLRVSSQLVSTELGQRDTFAFEEHDEGVLRSDERYQIIRQLLIPVFSCLAQCYEFLDGAASIDGGGDGEIGQSSRHSISNGSSTHSKNRRGKQQRPPPPRGMLSLNNYTDIAILLEFWVCTSILPHLDDNVLTALEDRVKYLLPKSLAGRIPRQSLLWGAKYLRAKQQDQPNKAPNSSGNSSSSIHHQQQLVLEELECTVAVIGRLILLDRFRPMLLPRHLTDLYAAIFQEDHLRQTEEPESDQYKRIGEDLFPGPNSKVDTVSQARTCQNLLLKGTRGPQWLREVVSQLLTDLTLRDLRAIVHVFVRMASSSQEDMTSAAVRLAGPLTSVEEDDEYYKGLCSQLVSLLDIEGPMEKALSVPDITAGILTVLACLDIMHLEKIHLHLLPVLTADLLEPIYSTFRIHTFVRRMVALLSLIPSSHNSYKIGLLCKTPFKHSDQSGSRVSILGQLIRIGAIQTVALCPVKEDALLALRLMVRAMAQAKYPLKGKGSTEGTDVLSLALLHTLQDSWWDKQGFTYKVAIPEGDNGLTGVGVDELEVDESDIAGVLDTLEVRVTFVIEQLLVPLASSTVKAESTELSGEERAASEEGNRLVSSFFHLLLICYFNVMSKQSGEEKKGGENNDLEGQFAVMVALPMLCEACPPDALILGGREGGGKSILKMMKVILSGATAGIAIPKEYEEENELELDRSRKSLRSQASVGRMLTRTMSTHEMVTTVEEADIALQDPKEEGLLSTASVVLSLLIAMLELGLKRRKKKEEKILESMLPTLRHLSMASRSDGKQTEENIAQIRSEMAEMSSHAMALIVSRKAPLDGEQDDFNFSSEEKKEKSFEDSLRQAEADLRSDQPPIRARGLVTLRHIARGWLSAEDGSASRGSLPLIQEIDPTGKAVGDDAANVDPVAEILRVALMAMSDSESYVYQAGIQTVVAAVDVRPQEALPLVGRGLCTGRISFGENIEDVTLSAEQRIKLAEALSFTLRRRGDGVTDYVPRLMQLMIHGGGIRSTKPAPSDDELIRITEETSEYFNNSEETDSDDDGARQIRLNAGGPLFQTEEDDVVRSACINIVSELLGVSAPNIMATFCFDLVKLAKNALVLEASRPVRRSTALLCRELYRAVLRELDTVLEKHERGTSVITEQSLLLTVVEAGEEALHVTLEQNLDLIGAMFDAATKSRCEEALEFRREAAALGLFAAAEVYIMTEERDKEDLKAESIMNRLGSEKQQSRAASIRNFFRRSSSTEMTSSMHSTSMHK